MLLGKRAWIKLSYLVITHVNLLQSCEFIQMVDPHNMITRCLQHPKASHVCDWRLDAIEVAKLVPAYVENLKSQKSSQTVGTPIFTWRAEKRTDYVLSDNQNLELWKITQAAQTFENVVG